MEFTLTESLIRDIIFAMEDQGRERLLDSREGTLVEEKNQKGAEPPALQPPRACGPAGASATPVRGHPATPRALSPSPEERYLPLPRWDSAGGYKLMEQFAALYREPRVREELRAALDQGRGVFRAFKNTLARNPEAERRWHTFKERELRRRVLAWYDDLRISWGLERLGPEPEETEELLLEDFRFRPPAGGDDEAAAALRPGTAPPLVVAETAAGDFAGYGALRPGGPPAVILEVAPEYRGIGLGEALLERVLEAAPPGPLILDLPAEFESFAGALRRHSFSPLSTRYLKR